MNATLLFLPVADEGYRWLRIAHDRIAARGDGAPALDGEDLMVAVAPADAVALHWAELPRRSPAQAVAAARLLAAEASAAPIGELHVAVGDEGTAESPIGIVATARMRSWLDTLTADGLDPDRIIPAPMLLPRPDNGYARADLGGGRVVRGTTSAFADEGALTDLVIGDAEVRDLARDALERAIAVTIAAPPLDLRQGAFARRRAFALDWALIRRLAWMALAILTVTLATDLVRIARYSFAADALTARADALARETLPRGEVVNDADRQLDALLAGRRGPGLGFTRTAAAVFAAIRAVPGSEATALAFGATGELRVSVATTTEGQANALKDRIVAAGFRVTSGAFTATPGRLTGQLTVSAR